MADTTVTTPSPIHFMGAVILNLTRSMIGAYALSTILFMLANVAIGEENWVVLAFFNSFAHLIWLPALILLPLCLLFRAWQLTLMLIPVAVLFIITFGGRFVPNEVTIPPDAEILTIATYNIMGGNGDISAVIRQLDADIVAIQELSFRAAEDIERTLTESYPHQALHPRTIFTQGQGIISRYPITEDEFWQYDWLLNPLGHQRSVVALADSRAIVMYNVHPTHPGMNGAYFNPQFRSCELHDILRRTVQETQPIIWLGDFNMPELSNDYAAITKYYIDGFDAVGEGMGWTFPVTDTVIPPFLRIDYAFFSEDFMLTQADIVNNSAGSDHYPIRFQTVLDRSSAQRNIITPAMPQPCRDIMVSNN